MDRTTRKAKIGVLEGLWHPSFSLQLCGVWFLTEVLFEDNAFSQSHLSVGP